ncbi:MAG: L-aspartate oxidase [Deltaproteobacteria bacterium]|uniref:L-aspartate oxidase n=1 Tax=Candidatus Zymogenus saltonus TaxID=2844893 RepID=A0A9D8K9N9_9DELT|nr:L-aspartate oxidase [Candidatus Zymogenus saltonus]
MEETYFYDYLVVGSGIAGLSFALKASESGRVAVITKKEDKESNTNYAQGGIASVMNKLDSFEYHIKDTLKCGAGICHADVVEMVVKGGPDMIRELVELGANFSMTDGDGAPAFDLGMEGGHSQRRIVHAKDLTGAEIERALIERVRENENIDIFENHIAVNLITDRTMSKAPVIPKRVWGAYVLDTDEGNVSTFLGRITYLASGGAGKVYLYTSNPDIASGDGIAMAYRAGAEVGNLEFVQFHPTCLYHPDAKSFLISEAVRGEGAILRLANGEPFMKKYSEMKDLAPRDIVARSIDSELKRSGDDCVFLDITHREASFIRERFPNIYGKCLQFGIDITTSPIPVVPAAHYMCGGVVVDKNGKSSVEGLYCGGEVTMTGLHGANRLASNSLLEAVVYADRGARRAAEEIKALKIKPPEAPPWDPKDAVDSDEEVVITQNWEEVRRFMWNYVGIVRSDKRLERAMRRSNALHREITDYYWNFTITSDLIELRNIALLAYLIIRSAMSRKESRGLHYNIDHPKTDDKKFKKDTILVRKDWD